MQRTDCRLPLLFYSLDQVQSHEFQLYDLFISVLASTRTKCRPIILEKWRIGLVWLGIPEMYTYTFL